jgi:hypothetical protein
MTMISKTVAERTGAGQRQSVEEQGSSDMAYNSGAGLR